MEGFMSEYRNWLLTEEAHAMTLTLNRPDAMNSLTAETLFELRDITTYLRTRRTIWVIIIQGQGEHFSTGMEVGEFIRKA
jgi:enoyl-CoA hydratase/carnithine racemase